MEKAILNEGCINGHCITGDNNKFYNFYIMSKNLNEAISNLANSQSKLADAISETMQKRSEAELIRAQAEKQRADNYALELKIREKEADNNSVLILSIKETLVKINEKL